MQTTENREGEREGRKFDLYLLVEASEREVTLCLYAL